MDDLAQLELVGLVNKVASELQNHIDVNDKTLAEFIIAQRLESGRLESFKRKMTDISGDSFTLA